MYQLSVKQNQINIHKKYFSYPWLQETVQKRPEWRWWGVAIYVREDIPSLAKNDNFPWNVEAILVEINPRKAKLAMLDKYSSYDKFLIPGDLNMQEGYVVFDNFMEVHQARNLVKEPTCYKNIWVGSKGRLKCVGSGI